MSWVPIILLALAAFAIAAFALRLPRGGWTMLGAVLLFGLAGYAWQGSPGRPADPRVQLDDPGEAGWQLVQARRQFYDSTRQLPRYQIVADAFTRQGRHDDAATVLRGGLDDNPRDGEAWTALAIALTAHAQGQVTPAADWAFERAAAANGGNPAPGFFRGAALLETGDLDGGGEAWAAALAGADPDSAGARVLRERLELLDRLRRQQAQTRANP